MTRIYLSPPHMGPEERAMLLDAFDSNWVAPAGPHLRQFEKDMSGMLSGAHTAALSSGTAALHLALLLLDVQPGDEVIVSTLTFAASANVIRYVGAEPIFIDCDTTWTMSPELLSEAIDNGRRRGKLPKAVITVDLFGQCADYDAIHRLCDPFGIAIVQDAAEALGASYRRQPAGVQGQLGVLSFNGNKIITTSGGGMLVSNRMDWIERARFLATQARDPAPHYEHSQLGYNYRLSNLLAAVGRAQLAKLSERVAKRRANFERYMAELGDLPGWNFMPEAPYGRSNRWLTTVTIDPTVAGADRETIRLRLEEHDIESRPVWKPMHLQPVFRDCRVYGGALSEQIFDTGLCLPSGSSLTDDEQERVISLIRAISGHPATA